MSFALSLSVLICLRFAHDDGTCTSSLACLALNPSSGDTKGAGYLAVGAESGESARYITQQHATPQCARSVDVTCCTSVDFNRCISCSLSSMRISSDSCGPFTAGPLLSSHSLQSHYPHFIIPSLSSFRFSQSSISSLPLY